MSTAGWILTVVVVALTAGLVGAIAGLRVAGRIWTREANRVIERQRWRHP